MTGYAFTLGTAALIACASGALFWPDQRLLICSDLHFGKSNRLARRGGALLPPYETRATLARLDADLTLTGAQRVICLGDSFDDLDAADALDASDRAGLAGLMAGRSWVWIEGNHDPGPALGIAGRHCAEMTVQALTFRHIGGGEGFEISGHYHPKARLSGRSRRCFLIDANRVILPAYGEYTGGLWCDDPALTGLMGPRAIAVLTGTRALPIPMPRT